MFLSNETSVSLAGDGNSVGCVGVPGSPLTRVVTSTNSLIGFCVFAESLPLVGLIFCVTVETLLPVSAALAIPATQSAVVIASARHQMRFLRMLMHTPPLGRLRTAPSLGTYGIAVVSPCPND